MNNWFDILKSEFDHPATVLWRAVELRHIEEFLKKHELSSPILDLGCAEGKIAGALFKNKELIGLDNCWELISENKKTNIYKALILADGCRMPFKDGVFGSVFSNCVIEHIRGLDSVAEEAVRVLKDNGLFLFTVPSHKFGDFLFFSTIFENLRLRSLSSWYKNKRNAMLNHFHCYEHNYWREFLNKKGLELVEYKYYMTKEATFAWDFLAVAVRLLPGIYRLFPVQIKKYYTQDSDIGAGLLIVARKKLD